ncbi:MAG: glycosyltransferase family protein [Anaerolineales bacterium]
MPSIKALLPKRFKNILRMILGKTQKRPPAQIFGFKEFCAAPPTQRALVSYLVSPLLPVPAKRDQIVFSNLGIAQYIPHALNELGFEVDIVSWDDMEWLPSQRYDLYIGHGGINFEHISRALPDKTVQIYFSTGIYWKEFNIREARRIYELALRKGYLLPPDRVISNSEEYANQAADGIICLGNQNAVQSYSQFPLTAGINNAVYPLDWHGFADKDFEKGRNHFLFFSGGGSLHKGLDLLLEAFVGTSLHLHICQIIDPAFAEIYKDELTQHSNIHVYGHIRMRSAEFEQLVSLCNWTILATACEGQPGAILECMAYGLIPILTAGANIDFEDFGILLPDNGVDEIRTIVLDASQMTEEECRYRAQRTSSVIREEYSPEQFTQRFKETVQNIIEAKSLKTHSQKPA